MNEDVNKLLELIDSVKMYSGCDDVGLFGNHKTFEELISAGFQLDKFKCTEFSELDESHIYIIPLPEHKKSLKVYFEG